MKNNKKGWNILLISLIILIIICIIVITILLFSPKKAETEKRNNNYLESTITIMKQYNVYEKIMKNEYSKTIEVMLEEKQFQEKYLNNYYDINYYEDTNFTSNINLLLDKNYNSEEVNYIVSHYYTNINILLDMDYVKILDFKDITNFKITNLERYLNYQKENNYDIKTVVTYVNIGLDQEGYSNYITYTKEEAENDLTILVNKYHKLPDDYEPSDLVSLSYNKNYKLRSAAAEAFEKLTSAALIDNVIIYPFSPYRSFETQTVLYNRYKARDGEKLADTYSARPGFSEHQLGLAVDIRSSILLDNLTEEDYQWMLDNSYKYGFIVRYPKGKQHITQFIEEPWHIRYLGIELATKVHDTGLTYDEYYDLYMEKTQD